MPRGNKNLGRQTGRRFTKDNAMYYSKRGNEAKRAKRPYRLALKGIAVDALYGRPPVEAAKLQAVADFYGLKSADEVTFAHLAMYALMTAAAKGSGGDLDRVAAYAGEKPAEKLEVTSADYSELDGVVKDLKQK